MSSTLAFDSPFLRRAVRRRPACRLFCLPYVGGAASAYAAWPDLLPDRIECLAVQLPAREDRIRDRPFTESGALVRALAEAMRPYLRGGFALVGHSSGALLAFELARATRDRFGAPPRHVFVSGQAPPDQPPRHPPTHALPDAAFLEELSGREGTAPEILANRQLLGLLLPGLRADFALWETYRWEEAEPLACPITAFGGTRDGQVDEAELEGWRRHTSGAFAVRMFEGGHFFFRDQAAGVAGAIAEAL